VLWLGMFRQNVASAIVASLVVVCCLGGCRSWEAIELASAPAPLGHVRVRRGGSRWVELRQARVEGDTALVGYMGEMTTVAVPLGSITGVEQRRIDGAGTIMTAILVPIGAAVFFLVLSDGYYTLRPGAVAGSPES
jgi:hypothetical protein